MASYIPQDLVFEILSQLPVKSLLRLQCVSQSWKDLIKSPRFIQKHLNRQRLNPNSALKVILNQERNHSFFSADFNSVVNNSIELEQLEHPIKNSEIHTHVVGSCNGLVLLYHYNLDEDNYIANGEYGIWNPSTRMFKKLPACGDKRGRHISIRSGFGFDICTNDYKLVKICQRETMVYSLASDSWKKGQNCPFSRVGEENGVLGGGALHWIARGEVATETGNFEFVLGFDIGAETFFTFPFPEFFSNIALVYLSALRSSVCLINVRDYETVDVWFKKDCGWMKFCSVEQLGVDFEGSLNLIGYVGAVDGNSRELLLEVDCKQLMWYNVEQKLLKVVGLGVELSSFEAFVCLATLVPLDGGWKDKASTRDNNGDLEELAELGMRWK